MSGYCAECGNTICVCAEFGWEECGTCQGEGGWPEGEARKRLTFLRVDEMRMLDHWCESLRYTFGEIPYLVGSCITRANFRDVDIRIPIDDEKLTALPMRLRDLNMLLSQWGQRVTGLPIDCQVQPLSVFRAETGAAHPRRLLSITTHPRTEGSTS